MEDLSSPGLLEVLQETNAREAAVNDGKNINVSKDDPTLEPSGKNIGTKICNKRFIVWNLFEALPIIEGEKKNSKV